MTTRATRQAANSLEPHLQVLWEVISRLADSSSRVVALMAITQDCITSLHDEPDVHPSDMVHITDMALHAERHVSDIR